MSTSHGFRIHPAPPAPPPGAVQALSGLSVSHLSGMIVEPGDIVCGDLDGLVSVSPATLHRVVDEVHGLRQKEEGAIAAMQAGTLDRAWVDDALRANGLQDTR